MTKKVDAVYRLRNVAKVTKVMDILIDGSNMSEANKNQLQKELSKHRRECELDCEKDGITLGFIKII